MAVYTTFGIRLVEAVHGADRWKCEVLEQDLHTEEIVHPIFVMTGI